MRTDTYTCTFSGLRCSGLFHHLLLTAALVGSTFSGLSQQASSVILAWDPPTNPVDGSALTNFSGYRIYYGTASKTYSDLVDAGRSTTATLTNLQEGLTYFFAAAAYNSIDLDGDFSPELTWTPPAPPASLPVDYFDWTPIPSPQPFGAPLTASITARDASNLTAVSFTGTASLSGLMTRSFASGTGTGSSIYPLATSSDDARTQVIFPAREVGSAGWITAIGLDVKTSPGQLLNQWTIRLKNTPLSSYPSKPIWESSDWTTTHQSALSVTATGLTYFTFSTPFYFNGTNNLMVDFSFNNTTRSRDGYTRYTSTSTKRTIYYKANSTYGDPLTWSKTTPRPSTSSTAPDILFKFAAPVSLAPLQTTSFIKGQWTGTITVSSPATNLILSATDDSGHTGDSPPIDVIDPSGTTPQAAPMALAAAPALLPTYDFDEDSLTDEQELIAGTDPYDSTSLLMLTGLGPQTGTSTRGYSIQWASVPGRYYTVLRSTNLTEIPAFTPIATHIPGLDPITSYTDPDALTGTPCFYQIQVEP